MIFVSEKTSELNQLRDNTEMNILELEKILKLKILWENLEPSGVQHKLNELVKRVGKGGN